MPLDTFLAGNLALGLAFTGFLLLLGWLNRSFVRDIRTDPDRLWRIIAWVALAANALLIGWITWQDNWRQLTAAPYRNLQLFPSKRVEYNPPAPEIRQITLVLLGLALVVTACLVARHIGGYGIQLVIFLGALVAWIPFFVLRHRLDLNLALGFTGPWWNPVDAGGYLLFVVLTWIADFAFAAVSYLVLLMLVALPVTLLLDLTRLRHPRVRGEAGDYFQSIAHRS